MSVLQAYTYLSHSIYHEKYGGTLVFSVKINILDNFWVKQKVYLCFKIEKCHLSS